MAHEDFIRVISINYAGMRISYISRADADFIARLHDFGTFEEMEYVYNHIPLGRAVIESRTNTYKQLVRPTINAIKKFGSTVDRANIDLAEPTHNSTLRKVVNLYPFNMNRERWADSAKWLRNEFWQYPADDRIDRDAFAQNMAVRYWASHMWRKKNRIRK